MHVLIPFSSSVRSISPLKYAGAAINTSSSVYPGSAFLPAAYSLSVITLIPSISSGLSVLSETAKNRGLMPQSSFIAVYADAARICAPYIMNESDFFTLSVMNPKLPSPVCHRIILRRHNTLTEFFILYNALNISTSSTVFIFIFISEPFEKKI